MKKQQNIAIVSLSIAAILFLIISQTAFLEKVEIKNSDKMKKAVLLATSWQKIIQKEKESQNLISIEANKFPSEALLGEEFSEITTTLGLLEAKKNSVNPQFAAIVVQWLTDIGIDSTEKVMVTSSGSFPGLAISTLAALQTMHQPTLLVTSVGASSYGANQPHMTLLDIENLLKKKWSLKYQPELITYGCDNDNGEGFYEGGKESIDAAVLRNGAKLWRPSTLEEAIKKRVDLAKQHQIKLLINIGGNHAMLGNCSHASSFPNGLHYRVQTCAHFDRGAIARINELGIPVIHFLNIKELGMKYGITDSYNGNNDLFMNWEPSRILIWIFLTVLFVALIKFREKL